MDTTQKLTILAASAKYDVSCASSGSRRRGSPSGIGSSAVAGCCHSWSEDGRCVSLLKILFSNVCISTAPSGVNRAAPTSRGATFPWMKMAELTLKFYKRTCRAPCFFRSSGVLGSLTTRMECLTRVLKLCVNAIVQRYIHFKAIPGADRN